MHKVSCSKSYDTSEDQRHGLIFYSLSENTSKPENSIRKEIIYNQYGDSGKDTHISVA